MLVDAILNKIKLNASIIKLVKLFAVKLFRLYFFIKK
mgnify:CR=1 FL=1